MRCNKGIGGPVISLTSSLSYFVTTTIIHIQILKPPLKSMSNEHSTAVMLMLSYFIKKNL